MTGQQPRDEEYNGRIDSILSRELRPENIDTIADQALTDIIGVIDDVVHAYRNMTNTVLRDTVELNLEPDEQEPEQTDAEQEDEALGYFGLDDVGHILGHLSGLVSDLHRIDTLLTELPTSPSVIVPTDRMEHPITPGGTPLEEKQHIQRLKTVLLILMKDFGLDVFDEATVHVTTGQLTKTMMRGESYKHVFVPSLNRSILVCDEEGNATFVFDTEKLERMIQDDTIEDYSKRAMEQLLVQDGTSGTRIIYGNNFIDNVRKSLQDEFTPHIPRSYLAPNAPSVNIQEVISTKTIEQLTGVNSRAVLRVVEELGEQLGPIETVNYRGRDIRSYTQEQRRIILDYMEQEGYMCPIVPEDYQPLNRIHKDLGTTREVALKAIDALGDALGEVRIYRFGSNRSDGYSPEQQTLITEWLIENDLLSRQAPEGFLNSNNIAKLFGISYITVDKAIEELGEAFGSPYPYKHGSRTAHAYSATQQQMLREHLESRGILSERPPEGYATYNMLAEELGVSRSLLKRICIGLGEQLGDINNFRIGAKFGPAFSTEQQEVVKTYFSQNNLTAEHPPEGYMTQKNIQDMFGIGRSLAKEVISDLSPELGEVVVYRFSTRRTPGFSPEQVDIISRELEERGFTAQAAPKGYESTGSAIIKLRISPVAFQEAIHDTAEQLGEIRTFKFGRNQRVAGYSPEQIEIIKNQLAIKGFGSEDAPEGYLSGVTLYKDLHISSKTLQKIVDELHEKLGNVPVYRFGRSSHVPGYSPEQVQMIREHLGK